MNLIAKTFHEIPNIQFLIRNLKYKKKFVKRLAGYAFDIAIEQNGVFISNNGKGVAICFDPLKNHKLIRFWWLQIKLIFTTLNLWRLPTIIRHNKAVEAKRQNKAGQLYFWFFAADPRELPKISAPELTREIFHMADVSQKNIYCETTLVKNKVVYERFGFETYDTWFNSENGITVYFLRRSPRVLRHLRRWSHLRNKKRCFVPNHPLKQRHLRHTSNG